MQLKDYYKTLGVQPNASMQQIKKSFRQLAQRHHPDKNPGNAVAEAVFREIQEAYETLIDAGKREEYNYKRWYNRSVNNKFSPEPLTPAAILRASKKLCDDMQTVNPARIDFDTLSHHIRQLLGDQNTAILLQHNDEKINAAFIGNILPSAGLLPIRYLEPITAVLLRIAGNNVLLTGSIQNFIVRHRQQYRWQKYQAPGVVLLTLFLCLIIYFLCR
ncbi:MAG: J domain-containing protein [Bacteroidota bacterium]